MGTRTYKHAKHEHTIKTVNEEVLGIKMDDRDTDKISESFGWDIKKFGDCLDIMAKFFSFQDAGERLDDDLPHNTKTSNFVDFLKSYHFKKLDIKLETPNDYLMIGFIYCATITTLGMSDTLDKISGLKGDPEKLLEILREFKDVISQRRG